MRIDYRPIEQAAYIRLLDSKVVESEEPDSGIVYDFDREDNLVGIELYHLNKIPISHLTRIYKYLKTKDEKQEVSKFFDQVLSSKVTQIASNSTHD